MQLSSSEQKLGLRIILIYHHKGYVKPFLQKLSHDIYLTCYFPIFYSIQNSFRKEMPINHTKKSLSMKQKATKSVWGEPLIKLCIVTKINRREPFKMQDGSLKQLLSWAHTMDQENFTRGIQILRCGNNSKYINSNFPSQTTISYSPPQAYQDLKTTKALSSYLTERLF